MKEGEQEMEQQREKSWQLQSKILMVNIDVLAPMANIYILIHRSTKYILNQATK